MRKFCFIMTVVFLSYFCMSCGSEVRKNDIQYSKSDYQHELGRFAGLNEDTEWQIVQAYQKKLKNSSRDSNDNLTINDVWVEQYYGSYCPIYLFPESSLDLLDFLRNEYLDAKNHTVIAVKVCVKGVDYGTGKRDVIINIPNSSVRYMVRYYDKSTILLWDKGQLYAIENLDYQNPLLAAWDFRKIINRHNGLDFETDAMIRESLGKYIMTGWLAEEYPIINMKYLGTYNGYAALTVYETHLPAEFKQIIDGVLFYYPSRPIYIRAWKDGALYELDYLYEQGLITHEDLVEMAYFHHGALVEKGEDYYYEK